MVTFTDLNKKFEDNIVRIQECTQRRMNSARDKFLESTTPIVQSSLDTGYQTMVERGEYCPDLAKLERFSEGDITRAREIARSLQDIPEEKKEEIRSLILSVGQLTVTNAFKIIERIPELPVQPVSSYIASGNVKGNGPGCILLTPARDLTSETLNYNLYEQVLTFLGEEKIDGNLPCTENRRVAFKTTILLPKGFVGGILVPEVSTSKEAVDLRDLLMGKFRELQPLRFKESGLVHAVSRIPGDFDFDILENFLGSSSPVKISLPEAKQTLSFLVSKENRNLLEGTEYTVEGREGQLMQAYHRLSMFQSRGIETLDSRQVAYVLGEKWLPTIGQKIKKEFPSERDGRFYNVKVKSLLQYLNQKK